MAGGASLISYPVLLALGLPPISAAVTNSVGVTTANFFAIRSSQYNAKHLLLTYRKLILLSLSCAIIGAILLLSLPPRVFEKIVPYLLIAATLTLLMPSKIRVGRRNEIAERIGIAASGLYCGYFGPGQGVMVVASLARGAKKSTEQLNAAKNMIVGVTSTSSNVVYLFSGQVNWSFALALALGSSLGGTIGGKWAGKISPIFYKVLIMSVGFGASLWLFIR